MDIVKDFYEPLRESESFAAWREARAAKSRGECVTETAGEHIARLQKESAEDDL